MTLQVECKRCHHVFPVEYDPNGFITESFIRGAVVHKQRPSLREAKSPYRDD
jgi:hypothetical protein